MKQVKDLCIGNKVFRATVENIEIKTIEAIKWNDRESIVEIYLVEERGIYTGVKTDDKISGSYYKYFTDKKKALEEQTELRKQHFIRLLNNVTEANKELSEFILEYSILK